MIDTTRPHTGSHSAHFCGFSQCLAHMGQMFTLPSGIKKLTLSYWLYVDAQGAKTCLDSFDVQLRTVSGSVIAAPSTVCNAGATGTWIHATYRVSDDLQRFAGQPLQVYLMARTFGSDDHPTSFYLDDISLTRS
jgi:hypothetical protein